MKNDSPVRFQCHHEMMVITLGFHHLAINVSRSVRNYRGSRIIVCRQIPVRSDQTTEHFRRSGVSPFTVSMVDFRNVPCTDSRTGVTGIIPVHPETPRRIVRPYSHPFPVQRTVHALERTGRRYTVTREARTFKVTVRHNVTGRLTRAVYVRLRHPFKPGNRRIIGCSVHHSVSGRVQYAERSNVNVSEIRAHSGSGRTVRNERESQQRLYPIFHSTHGYFYEPYGLARSFCPPMPRNQRKATP